MPPLATSDVAGSISRFGRYAGPLLAIGCYLLLPDHSIDANGHPVVLSVAGRATLAVLVWMAIWWMTEAIAIEATALLPIVAFPMLGIASIGEAARHYGSDVVFLFLGGFILAAALQRWGVDRRIAYFVLSFVGIRPANIVAGMMIATAFLSMWISNTATAATMLPIAMAVATLVGAAPAAVNERLAPPDAPGRGPEVSTIARNFGTSLMLSIAYAASIGGLATIIGSPPNGIAVRFIAQTYGQEITFLHWMAIGVPVALVLLPLAWLLLTWVLFPLDTTPVAGGAMLLARERARLGPATRAECITVAVFAVTILLWTSRPLLERIELAGIKPLAGLHDAGIAVAAALALFIIPVDRDAGTRAMDWQTVRRIPWGVLILFGGGLSLAAAVQVNGVSAYIANLAGEMGGWPVLLVLLAVIAGSVFLSELTSNTAQVATMLPVLAALAPIVGVDPLELIIASTLAASCAFMMPVGTPPNAIVFGSGMLRIAQMVRAGFWLNWIAILVITLAASRLIPMLVHSAVGGGTASIDAISRMNGDGAVHRAQGCSLPNR